MYSIKYIFKVITQSLKKNCNHIIKTTNCTCIDIVSDLQKIKILTIFLLPVMSKHIFKNCSTIEV